MNHTRRQSSRNIGLTVLRVALISAAALVVSMSFLYMVTWKQTSGLDEAGHTITLTIEPSSEPDTKQPGHLSHTASSSLTHYDEGVWVETEFTVPSDMWLTEFSTDYTGVSVHNFYVFIKGTHDTWCPNNPTAIYSGGTVSARRPITFDPPYGIFVTKGTTLVLRALYHEMSGEASDIQPSFSVHARYEPADDSVRSIPVSLYFITPGPCTYTRPVFPVPSGAKDVLYSSDQRPFVFPEDGTILRALAHFHAAYAKGVANTVSLFLNGKQIDTFTTTNVGDDNERNPRLLTDRLVTVRRGDILTMHAIFSNPSERAVPEGMAIIGFYVAQQKQ